MDLDPYARLVDTIPCNCSFQRLRKRYCFEHSQFGSRSGRRRKEIGMLELIRWQRPETNRWALLRKLGNFPGEVFQGHGMFTTNVISPPNAALQHRHERPTSGITAI